MALAGLQSFLDLSIQYVKHTFDALYGVEGINQNSRIRTGGQALRLQAHAAKHRSEQISHPVAPLPFARSPLLHLAFLSATSSTRE